MKLNQVINYNEWKAIVLTSSFQDVARDTLNKIFFQLYYKHGSREVRENFSNPQVIKDYWQSFFDANKQKLLYVLSTANEDFLSQDNIVTTETTDEANAFNTDYYGGEGQTGKDTATGNTSTTNKSINNKDKSRNFYDIADNYLFKQVMNTICETFIIDEEIGW